MTTTRARLYGDRRPACPHLHNRPRSTTLQLASAQREPYSPDTAGLLPVALSAAVKASLLASLPRAIEPRTETRQASMVAANAPAAGASTHESTYPYAFELDGEPTHQAVMIIEALYVGMSSGRGTAACGWYAGTFGPLGSPHAASDCLHSMLLAAEALAPKQLHTSSQHFCDTLSPRLITRRVPPGAVMVQLDLHIRHRRLHHLP